MTDTEIIAPSEAELLEGISLLLFSVNLPVQRLEADVDDIERFTGPGLRSPRLRLIEAMPPLTPAAKAIVRAMIRAYGIELFGRGSANAALRAMIKAGPVKFGQTAMTLGPDTPLPECARPLVAEFNRILSATLRASSRRPDMFFRRLACRLASTGFGKYVDDSQGGYGLWYRALLQCPDRLLSVRHALQDGVSNIVR